MELFSDWPINKAYFQTMADIAFQTGQPSSGVIRGVTRSIRSEIPRASGMSEAIGTRLKFLAHICEARYNVGLSLFAAISRSTLSPIACYLQCNDGGDPISRNGENVIFPPGMPDNPHLTCVLALQVWKGWPMVTEPIRCSERPESCTGMERPHMPEPLVNLRLGASSPS